MEPPFTIDVPASIAGSAAPLFNVLFGGRGAAVRGATEWTLNHERLRVRVAPGSELALTASATPRGRLTVTAQAAGTGANARATPAPLPGLEASPIDRLCAFLVERQLSVDHIGMNLPAELLVEAQWRNFVAELDTHWPVHVLQIPGSDVIAIALPPAAESAHNGPTRTLQAVELVYDHRATRTSFHVCVRVSSDKAETERRFQQPYGVYKPGDSAYFRSVTADVALAVPFYLDLAFAGGDFPDWTAIVAAMGRRWGNAAS